MVDSGTWLAFEDPERRIPAALIEAVDRGRV
jgi:hypothetical protein